MQADMYIKVPTTDTTPAREGGFLSTKNLASKIGSPRYLNAFWGRALMRETWMDGGESSGSGGVCGRTRPPTRRAPILA